jgi:hypothetical protein
MGRREEYWEKKRIRKKRRSGWEDERNIRV